MAICALLFYFEKGLIILINMPLEEVEDFKATSSVLLLLYVEANVSAIIIKTGTSKSKNGEMFVNLFMILLF